MASINEHTRFTEYCRCLCLLSVANSMEMTDDLRCAVMELGDYMEQVNQAIRTYDFVTKNRPRLEKLLREKLEERNKAEEPDLNRFYHEPSVKPCPFCGAPGEICVHPLISWGRCTKCGASTSASADTDEALRLWNMRAGKGAQERR